MLRTRLGRSGWIPVGEEGRGNGTRNQVGVETDLTRRQIITLIRLGVDPQRIRFMCRRTAISVIRREFESCRLRRDAEEACWTKQRVRAEEYLRQKEIEILFARKKEERSAEGLK